MRNDYERRDVGDCEVISLMGRGNCFVSADIVLDDSNPYVLKLLCDSGATVSALSEELYRSKFSHWPLRENSTVIKGFTGGEVVSCGVLSLPFQLDGHKFCHDFLVVPKASHMAVLGMDFMDRYDCNLHFGRNYLQLADPDNIRFQVPLLSQHYLHSERKVTVCTITTLPPRSLTVVECALPEVKSTGRKSMEGLTGTLSRHNPLQVKKCVTTGNAIVRIKVMFA